MILVSVSVRKFVYGLRSKQYSSKESCNRSKMFTTDVKKSQIYAPDSSKRSKLHNREVEIVRHHEGSPEGTSPKFCFSWNPKQSPAVQLNVKIIMNVVFYI